MLCDNVSTSRFMFHRQPVAQNTVSTLIVLPFGWEKKKLMVVLHQNVEGEKLPIGEEIDDVPKFSVVVFF